MPPSARKILIVESNPADELLLRYTLAEKPEAPFEIAAAANIEAALQELQNEKYDLVLLDLNLEDCQGLDCISRIHQRVPHQAVIVFTGVDDEQLAIASVNRGAQDYLVKGKFDAYSFHRAMAYAMERNQLFRRLEQAWKTEIQERKKTDQLKDDFISSVSHEMRTPLAIVKGNLENLRDGAAGILNENQSRLVENANRNLDRLGKIIHDLLNLARLESGKAAPQHEEIEFNDWVLEVVESFQVVFEKQGKELVLQPSSGRLSVACDVEQLRSLFHNLIDNALRYARKTVRVGTQALKLKDPAQGLNPENLEPCDGALPTHVQLSVRDDGEGIATEHQPRLFEKFEQINRPQGGAGYRGTGLGLSISREVVRLHHGILWVESEWGSYAEFKAVLPRISELAPGSIS